MLDVVLGPALLAKAGCNDVTVFAFDLTLGVAPTEELVWAEVVCGRGRGLYFGCGCMNT